ncbi:glycine receptor subunit alpha-2 [Exaiptasia diaphana]|uniref:Uncharacterized protein n=1 Tax=Exaiptasia diaphana TaxID=2652724 RepID=A0A913XZ82_EXADI|nr:glycine receptor subunit alpha-2 [Exaiptasia diaphana]
MDCVKIHCVCLLVLNFIRVRIEASTLRSDSPLTSETLERLFKKQRYDPRIRPNVNGPPTRISTGFWVLSIDSVSVTDMAFGVDIFLRQEWVDERLDIGLNQTLSLGSSVMSDMWLPDTYFKNAKRSTFHDVTAKNLMLRIGNNGSVHYNTRVTLKILCIMDLRLYPFDVQHCPLHLESYGYSVDDITMSVFTVFFIFFFSGNWSGLTATFTFQRTYSFYVIQIYGPSALIVVLSWISFMLPRDHPPARVTLGVTSVLTVVTVFTMSNQAMPRVNYVKAIDKYLITCFLFVFASLVEYAILLTFIHRQHQHKSQEINRRKKTSSTSTITNGEPVKIPKELIFSRRFDLTKSTINHRKSSQALKEFSKNPDFKFCHDENRCFYRDENIAAIDRYSLRLFPLAFTLFNLYYWICIFKFPYLVISRVNYVKAIDKYLITCFLFVFASLVEYAILLTFIHRQHQHKSQETNRRKKTSSTSTITNGEPVKIPKELIFSRRLDLTKSTINHRKSSQALKEFSKNPDFKFCHDENRCFYRDENIAAIDRYSLRLFPLAFTLFNLYYWICIFKFPYLVISR